MDHSDQAYASCPACEFPNFAQSDPVAAIDPVRRTKKQGRGSPRPCFENSRPNQSAGRIDVVLAFGCGVGFAFELSVVAQEVQTRTVVGKQVRGFREQFFDRGGRRHLRQQLQAAVMFEAGTSRD